MKKINLLAILNHSSCWSDIYNKLLNYSQPPNNFAGKIFEEFCKYYYLTEPSIKHEYKNVWMFSEIPYIIKEKLNLGRVDHGIDLVLEGYDNTLSAIQCKFRNDQENNISWAKDKLAHLFAEGDKADYFIVFTNASGLDKHSLTKKTNQLKLVTLGDLLNISSLTLDEIKKSIAGLETQTQTIKAPRKYQKKAIHDVINGFQNNDRGQLILPCGAGKTLISLWIKERLHPKHTLVLVPSLALLRQIKREWAANSSRSIPYICVCSEKDINKEKDHALVHTYEISGKVSTNSDEIIDFLNTHHETIVYATYQSLEKICKAIKNFPFSFDLAICDEAHKTSGSNFGLIHLDANILVKKRLYMTATPRVLSDSLKSKLSNEEINYIHDMSNPFIFGPEFHRMSFKQAIDKKILVDYKIIVVGISDKEIQQAIKQRKYISDNETIDEVANNYALEKFMKDQDTTHAITFHSSMRKAEAFKVRHQKLNQEIKVFHVNGNQTTNEREKILNDFKNQKISIITNARCLTEGIDVPAVDVIYFCDPKNSKIDIVQATGRALRKNNDKNKKLGYIVIPIFHKNKNKIDESIDSSVFNNLINVIRALSCHDKRLIDEITKIKAGLSKIKSNNKHLAMDTSSTLITMKGFENNLKQNLFYQVIRNSFRQWRSFDEAKQFVRALNLKNVQEWITYYTNGTKPEDIPTNPNVIYEEKGWASWPDWLGTSVLAKQDRKFLPFEEARQFVHSLNLKSQNEWKVYCRKNQRPHSIPSNPNAVYKNKGWISWSDWLGTDTIATQNILYRSFEEARQFVHTLNLKNQKEWIVYTKSDAKPADIPAKPHATYKNRGWISLGNWLGINTVATQKRKYLSFEEAKKFVHTLNLKNQHEWNNYCKNGYKPTNIPRAPHRVYKNEWDSLGDWLGTGKIAASKVKFLSFEEAKKIVHKLNLKSQLEWRAYLKSNAKLNNIPSHPDRSYINKGWKSWSDWLGTITT